MRRRRCRWLLLLCASIIAGIAIPLILLFRLIKSEDKTSKILISIDNNIELIVHLSTVNQSNISHHNCSLATCLDIFKCGSEQLRVYVHPLIRVIDDNGRIITPYPSIEFLNLRSAIINSRFYESNVDKACIIVPGIDILSTAKYDNQSMLMRSLAAHNTWNGAGTNHLLFVFFDQSFTLTSSSRAIIAAAQFIAHRTSFDIAIPMWNPFHNVDSLSTIDNVSSRQFRLLMLLRHVFDERLRSQIVRLTVAVDVLIVDRCVDDDRFEVVCDINQRQYEYPNVLATAELCAIIDDRGGFELLLMDAMKFGCIPLIVADNILLPFADVIDWKRFSIHLSTSKLNNMIDICSKLSHNRIIDMRNQLLFIFNEYLSSIDRIALTTLRIIETTIVPQQIVDYNQWNLPSNSFMSPLFLPRTAPNLGFTAVILAYQRPDSVIKLISILSKVPSLAKIIIVWNNPILKPPSVSNWPHISQPICIIQSKYNKLSNRFKPFDEIKTEAVFSIDDDITMLTVDEIEFAYQTWREYPDRLVGFPSRVHLYNTTSGSYMYNSEWSNNMSMVLTGAAFYHQHYGALYHSPSLPRAIFNYVNEHMNCEDIAMNFLIAHHSRRAPIKVTPRKRFVCANCASWGLSADRAHLIERSKCIDYFVHIYGGTNPLETVEYRADPVLYRVPNDGDRQEFNHIGQL